MVRQINTRAETITPQGKRCVDSLERNDALAIAAA
jgi:hypothetical protein